jgi:hypothetical protein
MVFEVVYLDQTSIYFEGSQEDGRSYESVHVVDIEVRAFVGRNVGNTIDRKDNVLSSLLIKKA